MRDQRRFTTIMAAAALALLLAVLYAYLPHEPGRRVALTPDATGPLPPQTRPEGYWFGYDRRLEPSEDARMYVSLLRYLEAATGYQFHLRASSRYGNVVQALGEGDVHFAAIGTLSFLEAHQRYGADALVAGVTDDGTTTYRALIITRPDSEIHTLNDLIGRTFTFGAPTSTQGHLIPRLMFHKAGIDPGQLAAVRYTNSHFETAKSVTSGEVDAGAIQDTLGRELAARGQVRIVAESRPFPSSTITVASGVPPQVTEAVRRALLDLEPQGRHASLLHHWEHSEMPLGFDPVDREALAELLDLAREMGLLSRGPEL